MQTDLVSDPDFVRETTVEQPEQVIGDPSGQGGVVTVNGLGGNVGFDQTGGHSGFTFSNSAPNIILVSPLTTKGDIYVFDGTNGTRKAAAANDARLTTDSTQTDGLIWIPASTGWGSPSGILSRAAYAAYAGQTVSNPPTQAEMQALDDAVKLLSQTVAAMLTDQFARKEIKA